MENPTKRRGRDMVNQSPVFKSALTEADDTAAILYTSGTTDQPKGAELSRSNKVVNARLGDSMYPPAEHDVALIILPLFHSFGQTVQ